MISGMLAIGNGEKCPFCEKIMTKDVKIFSHVFKNHEKEMIEHLFNKEDYYESKRKKSN
tara:strand:+ start:254 stop:430 length:177 start_codon:yes stop_codon:yes gene_type:complete